MPELLGSKTTSFCYTCCIYSLVIHEYSGRTSASSERTFISLINAHKCLVSVDVDFDVGHLLESEQAGSGAIVLGSGVKVVSEVHFLHSKVRSKVVILIFDVCRQVSRTY